MFWGGKMRDLTEKQEAVLRYIAEYRMSSGYPPTNREIAAHFMITPKRAHDHILALENKGVVRFAGRLSRSIEIVKRDDNETHDFFNVPIVGDIAAGTPILSEENIDGALSISKSMLKSGSVYFAMRVRGDSMIDVGIMSGDLAIIEKREYADNGQIVAAQTDEGGITLKRFFREYGRIRLQAENRARDSEYTCYTTNVLIAGVLALMFRRY
jgi:repressor LexA